MKILGIETSCDETACAVVEDGWKVLSNEIFSQASMHAKTGGVVPEVAAREHILKIIPALDAALSSAGCNWDDIDAVSVTKGPGLVSSLIMGTSTASTISFVKKKPLIPVHHIIGHIYANFLENEPSSFAFPILILTVSGGHNELVLMREHGDLEVLGETRDDAAGEAFDKVARILGLGYPGGPAIAEAAMKGRPDAYDFPRSFLEEGSLDFSFSGVKTAVLNEVKMSTKNGAKLKPVDPARVPDIAASFQEAVVDILTEKIIQAFLNLREEGTFVREIHLAGGVSANKSLREMLERKISKIGVIGDKDGKVGGVASKDVKIRWPKKISYCTDNAAMIASAGYFIYKKTPKLFKSCSNLAPTTNFDLF